MSTIQAMRRHNIEQRRHDIRKHRTFQQLAARRRQQADEDCDCPICTARRSGSQAEISKAITDALATGVGAVRVFMRGEPDEAGPAVPPGEVKH